MHTYTPYCCRRPATLGCELDSVKFASGNTVIFTAVCPAKHKKFELKLQLFSDVVEEGSSWKLNSVGRAVLTLKKAEPAVWPRLLQSKSKPGNQHTWWDMKEKNDKENSNFSAQNKKPTPKPEPAEEPAAQASPAPDAAASATPAPTATPDAYTTELAAIRKRQAAELEAISSGRRARVTKLETANKAAKAKVDDECAARKEELDAQLGKDRKAVDAEVADQRKDTSARHAEELKALRQAHGKEAGGAAPSPAAQEEL